MAAETSFRPGRVYAEAVESLRENPGQRDFFESTGNCLLLAGPGSGKTRSLTVKVARVLYEEIKIPHRIACITYSNECVRELSRRLRLLGLETDASVFVGTMHSFCLQNIIRPFAHLTNAGIPIDFEVASEADCDDCLKAAVFSITKRNLTTRLKSEIRRYRKTFGTSKLDRLRPDQARGIIADYEANLRAKGLIDSDDMILRSWP